MLGENNTKKNINKKIVIIIGILIIIASIIILSGKINILNIMGNSSQSKYACPSGYKLYNKKCTKTVLKCPDNAVLKNDKCYTYKYYCTNNQILVEKDNTFQCADNGVCLNGTYKINNSCYKFYCTNGYSLVKGSRTGKNEIYYCIKDVYSCPSGYEVFGGRCRSIKQKVEETYAYFCPENTNVYSKTSCKDSRTGKVIPATKKIVSKNASYDFTNKVATRYETDAKSSYVSKPTINYQKAKKKYLDVVEKIKEKKIISATQK